MKTLFAAGYLVSIMTPPLLPLLALLAVAAAAGGPITVTDDGTAGTLANANGVSATFTRGGAALQKLLAPDRDGKVDDIVLGLEDAKAYEVRAGGRPALGQSVICTAGMGDGGGPPPSARLGNGARRPREMVGDPA